jgi:hypothetical protein
MKIAKKLLLVVLIACLLLQAFRPEKNKSGKKENDITTQYPMSTEVEQILVKACNDCHSNQTNYPWYAEVQPLGWWLADHVNDGKKHLNFNEFANYRVAKQYHKLEECIDEVKDNAMPLESYTNIHKQAKLSEQEKTVLINWCTMVRDSIKARYPADSLVLKRK